MTYRAVILSGFAGAAWLAGMASAQAEPIAGPESETEAESSLSPVATSLIDAVASETEQAALSPASQLESATAEILDVPGELTNSASSDDAVPAKPVVDNTTLFAPLQSGEYRNETVDEFMTPRPSGGNPSTPTSEPDSVLGQAQPIADPLFDVTAPATAPLYAAAQPVAGDLDAVTFPVTGTLSELTRPVAAAAVPVSATFAKAATPLAAVDPGIGTRLLAPTPDGSALGYANPIAKAVDDLFAPLPGGVNRNDAHHQSVGSSAEPGRASVEGTTKSSASETSGSAIWSLDRSGPHPFSTPTRPDAFGLAVTGGGSHGTSLAGASSHDSGAGLMWPVHAGSSTEVSRVTPMTAAKGQLPDHVEDPAVSPD
ncbi:MAG: hypothetical protein ACRDXX_04200 [Stackebrandtia sp.]